MNNLPDEIITLIFKKLNICKHVENYKIYCICKNFNRKINEITFNCKIYKKIGYLYCKNHIFQSLQINLTKNFKYFFLTDFK